MPPASPVPPLPADCRVETLAKMLADANADYVEPRAGVEGKRYGVDLPERFCDMYRYMASAVRALVEAKVREAVAAADAHTSFESVDSLVAFVLGAP